ncbi:MAG: thiamine phosphate synthase [Deltaproteobacteria bacterium]|nr:thiamine phosphate synthase [Deltaproteobacteria bacterium]
MSQNLQGLYTIADNQFRPDKSHVQLAEAFLRGGAKIVQLRMKKDHGLWTMDCGPETIARNIMMLKKKYDFTFIVNDFVDVALEVGADGIHVGANDMPVQEVRRKVGSKMLIGYSSHSLAEALVAEKAGADYVAFGAIFPTKTKGPGHPVQSLEKLRKVVETLKVPVVAIGGIGRKNFNQVLETGVASVAMITALTGAPDIAEVTRYFAKRTIIDYGPRTMD